MFFFVFIQLFVVLYYFFIETDEKYIFLSSLCCWQFNSLRNDVCFNHLGQKLWEKIHFLQPKVNFSGEGKNTSIWTMCKIYNVNNNNNCWYLFLLLHCWNNLEICQKNKFHPPPSCPLASPICKIFNIHRRKKKIKWKLCRIWFLYGCCSCYFLVFLKG